MAGISKAFSLIRNLPRVDLENLARLPFTYKKKRIRKGRHGGRKCGRGHGGQSQRNTLPPLGFEGGNTPFHMLIPKEPYYEGSHLKRQYPPLSMFSLQRLIDLGRVDTSKPIDLTAICNTNVVTIDPAMQHYGINLTDQGADIFKAKVNLEVQWASEIVIAAVEREGGSITTRFFDRECVTAMIDPKKHFVKGLIIPRCKLPPQDAIEYYSSARNRGYLADPKLIEEARYELAQKYGYKLVDLASDPAYEMLKRRKDPRQIWFGLEPGWAVNLRDKCILKPTDEQLKDYYKS